MTEANFQYLIISYARSHGWRVYHTYDSRRSEPGFPDLVLVRREVLYRELKSEKGRLTAAQKAWGESLTKAGANYAVWRPSMLQEIYKKLK